MNLWIVPPEGVTGGASDSPKLFVLEVVDCGNVNSGSICSSSCTSLT
jgi:hypothetical protein